jgi:hypothetical protein
MSRIMHAWYSPWQANFSGHCIWETVDGRQVEVTLVTDEKNTECCKNIKDLEYRGEVVRCVQPMTGGKLDDLDLEILSSEKRVTRARAILDHVQKTMGIKPVDKVKPISMNRISFGIKQPDTWRIN